MLSAPLTVLFQFDFTLNLLSILSTPVIYSFTFVAGKLY